MKRCGRIILCRTCRQNFWITSIEERFYALRGVPLPEQCRICNRPAVLQKAAGENREDVEKRSVVGYR